MILKIKTFVLLEKRIEEIKIINEKNEYEYIQIIKITFNRRITILFVLTLYPISRAILYSY